MNTIQPGDVLLCDGGDASDLYEIATHFLSDSIQAMTRSPWTHAMMAFDPDAPINGQPQAELHVIESTILRGVNGVQLNPLSRRIEDYKPSGKVIVCHLKPRIRDFLDFGSMWRLAASQLGHDRYNEAELLEYLARHVPVLGEIPRFSQSTPGSEVCSEEVAMLLRAGGLPGLHPATMPPEALAELSIYSGYTQLLGEPVLMPRFNSV